MILLSWPNHRYFKSDYDGVKSKVGLLKNENALKYEYNLKYEDDIKNDDNHE